MQGNANTHARDEGRTAMKKPMKLVLLGACMAAFVACAVGCTAAQGTAVEVTDGRAQFSQGELEVQLDANPTTGYEWTCAIEGDAVTAEGDNYVASGDGNEPKAGEGGVQLFAFKASGSGEATLTFTYARSWESTDSDKAITLKATVENGEFKQVEEL